MTVVVVNDFAYVNGGAARIAIYTAAGVARKGIRTIFFAAVGPVAAELTDAGVEVICTDQKECLNYPSRLKGAIVGLWNRKAESEMRRLLMTLSRDETVIHVHGWTKALSASVFSPMEDMGFRVFITGHDYFTICPNGGCYNYRSNEICTHEGLTLSCIMTNCDKRSYAQKIYRCIRSTIQTRVLRRVRPDIIYVSEFSRSIIKPRLPFVSKEYFVPYPVPAPDKPLIIPENPVYYLYIGRISPEKGVDLFCRAVSELGLRAIVIGDGSERERLEREYPDIDFTGWLSQEEWEPYLRQAKAFVFPSLWYETAGLVIPEVQLRASVPAIVSDACAGRNYIEELYHAYTAHPNGQIKPDACAERDYIEEGKTGLLFTSGSIDSLKEQLKRIESGEIAFFEGIDGDRVDKEREKYSASRYVARLFKVYASD